MNAKVRYERKDSGSCMCFYGSSRLKETSVEEILFDSKVKETVY